MMGPWLLYATLLNGGTVALYQVRYGCAVSGAAGELPLRPQPATFIALTVATVAHSTYHGMQQHQCMQLVSRHGNGGSSSKQGCWRAMSQAACRAWQWRAHGHHHFVHLCGAMQGAPQGRDFGEFVGAARVNVLGLVPSIVKVSNMAGGGMGAARSAPWWEGAGALHGVVLCLTLHSGVRRRGGRAHAWMVWTGAASPASGGVRVLRLLAVEQTYRAFPHLHYPVCMARPSCLDSRWKGSCHVGTWLCLIHGAPPERFHEVPPDWFMGFMPCAAAPQARRAAQRTITGWPRGSKATGGSLALHELGTRWRRGVAIPSPSDSSHLSPACHWLHHSRH